MSASSNAALIACSLSAWTGEKGRCVWCNIGLPTRRHRWCSDRCASAFAENHWWTSASNAAKRRDGYRCVRCGKAKNCQAHHTTPLHTLSVEAITVVYPWRERRRVKHGDSGCWHHLDGLETLCEDCHHAEHHAQAGAEDPAQLKIGEAA